MPRKKRPPITFADAMRKLHQAGLEHSPALTPGREEEWNALPSLEERMRKLFEIVDKPGRKAGSMLFFVMYDIESNKVRRLVAKYLEKQGCERIQKSVFLADRPVAVMEKIKQELSQVNECYENHDSILVVPIPTDSVQSMKVIGEKIEVDVIMQTKNTIFF